MQADARHSGVNWYNVGKHKGHTAPQHLVSGAVQGLHSNHMYAELMSIVEVFVCRHLQTNKSMIPVCIRLKCRLCTAMHTKCCGAVTHTLVHNRLRIIRNLFSEFPGGMLTILLLQGLIVLI